LKVVIQFIATAGYTAAFHASIHSSLQQMALSRSLAMPR
jgi:hypothetical protein